MICNFVDFQIGVVGFKEGKDKMQKYRESFECREGRAKRSIERSEKKEKHFKETVWWFS